MQGTGLLALLGVLAPVQALIRFGCSQLTVQRLDPLVNPGLVPSPHLHQIIGGVSAKRTQAVTESRLNTLSELVQRDDGPGQP